MNIRYDVIYTDKWDSFTAVFQEYNHIAGKENTKGIEENNCRLRHRIRRAYRKTCCFSKKLFNHFKAFDLAFFYINYGFISKSILFTTLPGIDLNLFKNDKTTKVGIRGKRLNAEWGYRYLLNLIKNWMRLP